MSHPFDAIIQDTYKELQKIKRDLITFLNENGIMVENDTLEGLLERLRYLKIIKPEIEYVSFDFDKQGYITKVFGLNYVGVKGELPDDIDWGYYKVVDGKIELDEERKRLTEEVI